MVYIIRLTPSYFEVPASKFDSRYRYIRKSVGGSPTFTMVTGETIIKGYYSGTGPVVEYIPFEFNIPGILHLTFELWAGRSSTVATPNPTTQGVKI